MRPVSLLILVAAIVHAGELGSLADANVALAEALAGDAPADAAAALASLSGLYPKAEEADRKEAVRLAGKAAKKKDLRVRHGAFAALAGMKAKGSSKYLGRWLKPPKRFKGEIDPSYAEAIRAAGAIADTGSLSTLLKLSNHSDIPIAKEATVALGGYHGLPTKRRKALAFDLVDRLGRLTAEQRRKASEEVYARKMELAGATVQALQRLTGVKRETTDGWKRWKEDNERTKDPFN